MRTLGRPVPHHPESSAEPGGTEAAAGRSHPLTILTPVPTLWVGWLRFNWWRIRRRAERMRKAGDTTESHAEQVLNRLAFVSFAHWATLRSRGGPLARLRPRYLLFQSNFNGDARQYFEAFSRQLTREMKGMWKGAYGPPDPLPAKPFQDYILRHQVPAGCHHYYCAYPSGSVKMVVGARALEGHVRDLSEQAKVSDPEAFKAAYDRFLLENQTLL